MQIGRQAALQVLVDSADGEPEGKLILNPGLERRLVGNIVQIGRRVAIVRRDAGKFAHQEIVGRKIQQRGVGALQIAVNGIVRADAVAVAIHPLVDFIGSRRIDRPALEFHVDAERIVESAVIAVERQVSAPGLVAAAAIGRTRGLHHVVVGSVLAGRDQRIETEYVAELG